MLHDKDLKATVASMKANVKAQFSEVTDIAEDREFWRKGKANVEVKVGGPIMNLIQLTYTDNHQYFKLGKILQSIPLTSNSKWMAWWTDLHNPLHKAGYCLDPEFHAYDHITSPEALTDLCTMCEKIHGEGSAEHAKAQLHWQCFYKAKKGAMFSRDNTWTNAAKIDEDL